MKDIIGYCFSFCSKCHTKIMEINIPRIMPAELRKDKLMEKKLNFVMKEKNSTEELECDAFVDHANDLVILMNGLTVFYVDRRDGEIYRCRNIPKDFGLNLDEQGRIIVADE